MNIHSVMPLNAVRRAAPTPPPGPESATRILRAAIDVFAEHGFFNAQVADVARVAGVAAGTVYLYFRGKDDLLVSIFERSMNEALAEGRAAVAGSTIRVERLRAHRAPASRPPRPRPRPRRGVSGRAAAVDQVHGALLRDVPAGLPRLIRAGDRRRPAARRCSARDISADARRQDLLRRARRDGHQLDPQPPQVHLAAEADAVVDLFINGGAGAPMMARRRFDSVAVLGAGTMGAQIALHFANAGIPALLLDLTADVGARGPRSARARSSRIRTSRPTRYALVTHRRLRRRTSTGIADARLDHRSRRRAARHQAAAARARRRRSGAPGIDRQLEHVRHSRSRRLPKAARDDFRTALARHALLQSAALPAAARDHSRPPTPIPPSSTAMVAVRRSPCSARASSSRRTRRTSSPTTSALYGVMQIARRARERQVHDRRDRRDHRAGARPAEERDVPHDGYRRHRRPRARVAQPARAARRATQIARPSRCRRSSTR